MYAINLYQGQQIPEAGFTDSETWVDESNLDETEQRLNHLKKTQKQDIDLEDAIRSGSGQSIIRPIAFPPTKYI